jgi:hypothetical protein
LKYSKAYLNYLSGQRAMTEQEQEEYKAKQLRGCRALTIDEIIEKNAKAYKRALEAMYE